MDNTAYQSEHPGPFRTSNGISVDVEPFTKDNLYTFMLLELDEQFGGDMAYGNLRLRATDLPKCEEKFQKQNAIRIIIKQDDPEDHYDIYGFIVKKDWSPQLGILNISFLCTPRKGTKCIGKFFSKTKEKKFEKKKIDEVIKAVWDDLNPDEFGCDRFRWKTDPPDLPAMDFHQNRETDKDFLTRLCMSIRKKCLFAFDWEGLIIKDTLWKKDRVYPEKPEPYRVATGGESHQTDGQQSTLYNYKQYNDIENACTDGEFKYGKEISKNFNIEILNNQYRIVGTDVNSLQNNWRYNKRLYDAELYSKVTLRYTDNLPPLRLLDTIKYGKAQEEEEPKGPKGNISTYVVSKMHMFISGEPGHTDPMGNMFSVDIILSGIENILGESLPDKSASNFNENDDLKS